MKSRRWWIAAVVLFAASSAVSVQALPPDCSFERCLNNPDLVCAVPGTFHVIRCSQWLFAPPPEPTPKATALPAAGTCDDCKTLPRRSTGEGGMDGVDDMDSGLLDDAPETPGVVRTGDKPLGPSRPSSSIQ